MRRLRSRSIVSPACAGPPDKPLRRPLLRTLLRRITALRTLVAVAATLTLLLSGLALLSQQATAAPPGTPAFQRTWERTDRPVAEGRVTRTWMWGPEAFTGVLTEDYAESPGGMRQVQYFDKSRMEITNPNAVDDGVWFVTNGLLVRELVTGQLQVGDGQFEPRQPAQVNVAGDPDDSSGPTYASFAGLQSAPAHAVGAAITATVNRAGVVGDDASKGAYGVTAEHLVPETGHRVASVFLAFMTTIGTVYVDGQFVDDALFVNPFYATGFPISEAYWATVKVGGQQRDVLLQCFERRCLTYTPDNPAAWRVEMGNVGQHYYAWRHDGEPVTTPTVSATATTSAPATATATATSTATATATATATSTRAATATATSPAGGCHPSYPDHCLPPPPPDLNCGDLPDSWKPIRVLHNVPNPDPHRLDQDKSGVGCEGG